MEEERRKVYVEVDVTHRTDGTARPQRIKFENGEVYEIDPGSVLAAAVKIDSARAFLKGVQA